jgi:GDPmannose 4,6-dehydratase
MWKNLNAKRDWGHAKDYVRGMWQMLQQEQPEDLVLATGETTTVRAFCEMAFGHLGIKLYWEGKGINEKGVIGNIEVKFESSTSKLLNSSTLSPGETLIEVDPQYFRPTEVEQLIGDPEKAIKKIGWEPKCNLKGLVRDMVRSDISLFEKESIPEKLEAN